MNEKERLRKKLLNLRLSAGLSQGAVGKRLGYSTGQFISNWERGLSIPPISVIHPLAEIYNASPDVLFQHILDATIENHISTIRKIFYS